MEHARTSHVLLLIETRQKFAENVKEMEFIYNKKLATEAARYLEIKDKLQRPMNILDMGFIICS